MAGKVAEKATRYQQVAKEVETVEDDSRVVAEEVRANDVHPLQRLLLRLQISRSPWLRRAQRVVEKATGAKAEVRKARRVKVRKEAQGKAKGTEVITDLLVPQKGVERKAERKAERAKAAHHRGGSATRHSLRLTGHLRRRFSISCQNRATTPPKVRHRRAFGGASRALARTSRMVVLARTRTT